MVVTYMFGIEVGLKALIQGQGQKPPRIHDLEKLYGKVASTVRKRIEDKLVTYTGELRVSLAGLLSHHRNSLQEWRYLGDFQGGKTIHPSLIGTTLRAIIEVHTEIYGVETDVTEDTSTDAADVPLSIQKAAAEYMKEVDTAAYQLEGRHQPVRHHVRRQSALNMKQSVTQNS